MMGLYHQKYPTVLEETSSLLTEILPSRIGHLNDVRCEVDVMIAYSDREI